MSAESLVLFMFKLQRLFMAVWERTDSHQVSETPPGAPVPQCPQGLLPTVDWPKGTPL